MDTQTTPTTVDEPVDGATLESTTTAYDAAIAPLTAPISKGVGTIFGLFLTIVAGVAAIVAGIDGNDTQAIASGTAAVLTGISTIGLRGAQAVAQIRAIAKVAEPIVEAAAQYTYDPPVTVTHHTMHTPPPPPSPPSWAMEPGPGLDPVPGDDVDKSDLEDDRVAPDPPLKGSVEPEDDDVHPLEHIAETEDTQR